MVIWEIDKRLQSKNVKNKTKSKFKVSVRVKDPSPIIEVEIPLAIETNFSEDNLRGETYLELNVMWSITLK